MWTMSKNKNCQISSERIHDAVFVATERDEADRIARNH